MHHFNQQLMIQHGEQKVCYGNDDTVVAETVDGRATVASNQTSTGTETDALKNVYFNNDTVCC